jgi:murein DD-endopeptidase MepM/ murein hydrolase activator NlpD
LIESTVEGSVNEKKLTHITGSSGVLKGLLVLIIYTLGIVMVGCNNSSSPTVQNTQTKKEIKADLGGTVELPNIASVQLNPGDLATDAQVVIEQTKDVKVQQVFEETSSMFYAGNKANYEVRIVAGSKQPNSKINVTLSIPASLTELKAADQNIQAFYLNVYDDPDEQNESVEPLVPSGIFQDLKIALQLPSEAFYQTPSGQFEAFLVLALRQNAQLTKTTTIQATFSVKEVGKGCGGKSIGSPIAGTPETTSNFGSRIHPVTGERKDHKGTDFRAPVGTEIISVSDGTISKTKTNSGGITKGYGYYVEVTHVDGGVSRYAHLTRDSSKLVGSKVKAGDVIGTSGGTGKIKGPHLHFEYAPNGNLQNGPQDGRIDPKACMENKPPPHPIEKPTDPKDHPGGVNWGDPHLVTVDGYSYDFQAVGEFHLIKDMSDPTFDIQVRQQPYDSSTTISMNSALAFKVGTDTVNLFAREAQTVRVNGQPRTLGSAALALNGGIIFRTGDEFVIRWNSGDWLIVDLYNARLDLDFRFSAARKTKLRGLLGDYNGDTQNDLTTSAGAVVALPPTPQQLYGPFAAGWRLAQSESLFTYESGKSTASFTNLNFPSSYVTLESLSPQARAAAEKICRDAGVTAPLPLQACILDVALTENANFAQSLRRYQEQSPVFAGTTQIGVEAFGEISTPGQLKQYTFTSAPGQRVFVDQGIVSEIGLLGVIGLKIIDSVGMDVVSTCLGCGTVGVITLTKGGTYTMIFGSSGEPATGKFRVKLWNVSSDQVFTTNIGNEISNGNPGSGAGNIESPGHHDVYSFTATAGQRVFVDQGIVSETGLLGLINVKILDSTGVEVVSSCLGCGTIGVRTLSRGGTYKLVVGSDRDVATGTYRVKLWNVPNDQTFTTSIGSEISNGVPGVGAGRIESPGSRDVYSFTATAGQKVFFDQAVVAQESGVFAFIDLTILDSSGAEVASRCFGCGTWLPVTLTQGGTYTMVVGSDKVVATGTYRVRLNAVP